MVHAVMRQAKVVDAASTRRVSCEIEKLAVSDQLYDLGFYLLFQNL